METGKTDRKDSLLSSVYFDKENSFYINFTKTCSIRLFLQALDARKRMGLTAIAPAVSPPNISGWLQRCECIDESQNHVGELD